MDVRGSGGGYFYGPFTSTQNWTFPALVPAPGGGYGAWAHIGPIVPTGRGRWLELNVWPDQYGALYYIQIALGAAGSEVLFQPSDGSGFTVDWNNAAGHIIWNVPYTISFPTSVGIGNEFSIRCASVPFPAGNLAAEIFLWN